MENEVFCVIILMMRLVIAVFVLIFVFGCNDTKSNTNVLQTNLNNCTKLFPLIKKKKKAEMGDWMYSYPEDSGQSFKEYVASKPLTANSKQTKFYIVKIGVFDTNAHLIFEHIRTYLSDYFQIQTDTISSIALSEIPENKTRKNIDALQLNSVYIIDELLASYKPEDALALIAFSSEDLFPNDDWNFVFGQASLRKGLGVWSLARLGNYNNSKEEFNKTLHRALKIAAHETGHILGMHHCVKYECNINGSNSLEESDRQPEWLCWECLAKLCYNRNIAPEQHLQSLLRFHQNWQYDNAAVEYYTKALKLLE